MEIINYIEKLEHLLSISTFILVVALFILVPAIIALSLSIFDYRKNLVYQKDIDEKKEEIKTLDSSIAYKKDFIRSLDEDICYNQHRVDELVSRKYFLDDSIKKTTKKLSKK